MVHHNILTLPPYTSFLSPHPSPTPSFIASPSSSYSFLHCFIALPSPYSFLPSFPLLLPSLPHHPPPTPFFHCLIASPFPYSFLHCLTLLPLLLSSLPHPPPLLLPLLLHPATPSFIASPSPPPPFFITSLTHPPPA